MSERVRVCCCGEKLVNLRLKSIAAAQARAWKVNYAGMGSMGSFIRLSLYLRSRTT